MSETRDEARRLISATQAGSVALSDSADMMKVLVQALGLLATLCDEGDAGDVAKQELETHLEAWEKERATTDAMAAANVQLTATVRQLQREKTALEVSLADARQQYAATTTERLVLLSAYAMTYGAVRVTEQFALQIPLKVSTRCRDGVYEVIGGDLPNDFPSRLGVLVMLAARRVTATASADDTYALLQALGCPVICAADPVKLGTAATELADLVGALTSSRAFSSVMSRDTRAEELTRCCRMLIPLLDEPTQHEVTRRMMGGLEEPTRVRTHDRDCLCQRCLDEAGRGR